MLAHWVAQVGSVGQVPRNDRRCGEGDDHADCHRPADSLLLLNQHLELDAVRAQADDLRAELTDFDQLRAGTLSTFDAASLEDLSTVLAKARIARGWTQRQSAEVLGTAEQQIQRYEANDHRSASLARLCDIANALGVTVAQHAELEPSAA